MRQCICPNSTDGGSRGELCNKCSEVANVRFGSLGKNFLTFLRGCGHVPALLVRDARTRQKRACCRYQSLVLYLLVQRG